MQATMQVTLRTPRSEVWATMCTVGGMNREMAPFVRMTDPTNGAPFGSDAWNDADPASWQLLFGFIPFDHHRIDLVLLPDEGGFRESSTSWWYRVWRHERALLDAPEGCIVRDSVEVVPRPGLVDPIVGLVVRWEFRRRYRWLQRQFG